GRRLREHRPGRALARRGGEERAAPPVPQERRDRPLPGRARTTAEGSFERSGHAQTGGIAMKVKQVICAAGRSGYMHRDLLAIKSGKGKPNGSLYEGAPMSPGFTRIIEPATIISVMLV